MKLTSSDKRAIKRFSSLEKEFNEIHNNKYNYSNFEYKNIGTKSEIICDKHGTFNQSAENHLKGHGCPSCGNIDNKKKIKKVDIINELRLDDFDYSLIPDEFLLTEKLEIICLKHGVFKQTFSSHRNGAGCKKCYNESRKLTDNDFLEKVKVIHKNKYMYNLKNYNNGKSKIEISCEKHGVFHQTVESHLQGHGCPKCANKIRNKNFRKKYFDKPTTLYHIKISKNNNTFYKVGITTRTIEKRFQKEINDGYDVKVIFIEQFSTGVEAYKKEQRILLENKKYRYEGDVFLIDGGDSELFVEELLIT